jgi:peptidoglycan/xylan/chitin deacetylase (PgdA/CDA1 family)
MKVKGLRFLAIYFLCIKGFVSCKKDDVQEGRMPDGMIALSFDDNSVDCWYKYLPLMDSLGIKATYYISGYHKLKPAQKNKLRAIQAHGNEIGYHTTNHADLLKLYSKNSMRYLMDTEIKPDLKLMQNDGFFPENFAYPYGQHDSFLDRQLLVYFKSVRAVCTPKTYKKSLATSSGTGQVFYAPKIDARSKITDEQIENLMNLAHENHSCVFFYAHEINNPNYELQITIDRLRKIASLAQKYNLKFVTTSEVAQ